MGINVRSVIFINGIVICCLAVAMTIPMLLDLIFYSENCVRVFVPSIIASIFFGSMMIFSCRVHGRMSYTQKDVFLLVVSMWIATSLICAFPFYVYSGVNLNFMSALFESVSGISTTGASIYHDVEILPKAINLWRFILHFIGGVGIVAIGIIVLPIMRIGGMQLFSIENSDKTQRFFPRASQTIRFFIGIYILLIGVFVIALKLSGMNVFDSICHSISVISTGGFSTKNNGVNFFKSSQIEIVMAIGMFIGGITFLEIVKCFKNGLKSFFSNQQTMGYIKLVGFMIIVPVFLSTINNTESMSLAGIATHTFQIVSAITTTGLDFSRSYLSSNIVLILLAIIGGCSGSTTGGIKIFRIQILFAILKNHIKKLVRPFDVSIPKYQDKKIDDNLTISVVSFLVILAVVFVASVIALEFLTGKNSSESAYATVSCLFNLGYGADFADFSSTSKFVLICDMIIGRLEVIPVFIIFNKLFWKK